MTTGFLQRIILLLTAFVAMGPAPLPSQVRWTNISIPYGAFTQIVWPVYPTADGGLLMCMATDEAGVYYSRDDGNQWTRIPIMQAAQHMRPHLCAPRQSPLPFLMTFWGGLHRIDTENRELHRLEAFDSTVVTWIAASADGRRIVALANAESTARLLFVSEDGGQRWHRVHVQDVEFFPQTEAAGFSHDTLYVSTFNRVIWTLPPGATTLRPAQPLLPRGDAPLWFLGDGLVLMESDSTIMRSNDGGATWRDTRAGLPLGKVSLHTCARASDGTVYARINAGDQYDRLFRSADRGRTWNMIARDGDVRITRFQLTPQGEIIWQLGTAVLARSSGLALTVPVRDIPAPDADAGIYPQPLRRGERGTLWLRGDAGARWAMRVIDPRGAVRLTRDLQADAAGDIRSTFRPALPPGTYFVELTSASHRRLLRLQLLP